MGVGAGVGQALSDDTALPLHALASAHVLLDELRCSVDVLENESQDKV